MSRVRSVLLLWCSVAAIGAVVAPAARADPGPPISVTSAQLSTALACSGPLADSVSDPVLLTPAFGSGDGVYGWNYARQLPAIGVAACTLTFPDGGFGDLQGYAEYVVAAVRWMSAQRGGGQVVMLSHQHGALDELWALKFWPDLAAKVSDFISLATPYRGTQTAAAGCRSQHSCSPAAWQIATGSKFLAALARVPLPAGPSYSSIATAYDELITPQPTASFLNGAANITIQNICPLRPVEHFTILADAIGYRLALDAMTHAGPAVAQRISRSACFGPLYMPIANHIEALPRVMAAGATTFQAALKSGPLSVSAEPAVKSYATS